MDHPFYSPWYEWLFIKRPMYFASDQYMPADMATPFLLWQSAVWIGGLVGTWCAR